MRYALVGAVAATLLTPMTGASTHGFVPPRASTNVFSATARAADVDSLLAADRAFSAASAGTDLVTGLTAMFATDVTMPVPGTLWANGIDAVSASLKSNADNAKSRAEWTPLRGGVSADGQHGFTFGFMTVHRADGTRAMLKYMSYWVKGAHGWRVAGYKRSRRADTISVAATMLAPSLPARAVAVTSDANTLAANATSLKQAEQNFSDEAQKIGLGPAFAKNGTSDAVNMGSGAGYTIGAAAIAADVSGPAPSAGSAYIWNADKVLVASSGDLGVTFGVIHSNANPTAVGTPFFTIWRRASPGAPWRYVAE